MATKVSYDYGGKRINNTQEFILNAGETPEAITEVCSIGSTAYRPMDGKKWVYTGNGWTLELVSNGGGSAATGVEQSYVDEADAKVLADSKTYSDKVCAEVLANSKTYSDTLSTQNKEYTDTQDAALEEEILDVINNLPTHTLFGGGEEYKHFGIGLVDRNGPSLIEYILALKEKGLYTVYCDDGIKDNPISPVPTSAFRGLCHLTNLENEDKTKLAYGWVLLFDQEGHAYVNYIRRSVASGWVRQDALDEKAVELAKAYTDESINNLPTHTLFGGGEEYKHFGIGLIDRNGPSLIEHILSLKEKGLYTVYCDEGVKDNPISPVPTSAFRGLCHLTNLENENKTKLAYGWVILFDQEGHAYVNYIRRSVASGWVRQDALDEKAIELAKTYTDEAIKYLSIYTRQDENNYFGIRLTDANGPTLIEYVLGLTKEGLYTVYCDDPVPGNPVSSDPTSAFRGICNLTQVTDPSKNQLAYGWILLFDHVGHAYVSYIRRGVATEWTDLAKEPEIELVVDTEGRLISGTCNGKPIKITIQQ